MNKLEFKAEVKKQLTLRGWSYKELADATGYTQQSLWVIMCDSNKLSEKAMDKISTALGFSLHDKK